MGIDAKLKIFEGDSTHLDLEAVKKHAEEFWLHPYVSLTSKELHDFTWHSNIRFYFHKRFYKQHESGTWSGFIGSQEETIKILEEDIKLFNSMTDEEWHKNWAGGNAYPEYWGMHDDEQNGPINGMLELILVEVKKDYGFTNPQIIYLEY